MAVMGSAREDQQHRTLVLMRKVRDRIERAMTLLRRADMTVTDACFAVGFSSLGTFSTRFTELVGVSPRVYRETEAGALAGIPPCLAKQVSRPVRAGSGSAPEKQVRNREARAGASA